MSAVLPPVPPFQRRARFPRLWLIVLLAALHFGLLVFALYNGLVIWTGPTTPWEIFWAHALEVLLFPLDLFPWPPVNAWVQAGCFGFNSVVWGIVLAFVFTWIRHLPRKDRKK